MQTSKFHTYSVLRLELVSILVMAMKNWKILSIVVLDDLDFTVDHTIYINEYKSL